MSISGHLNSQKSKGQLLIFILTIQQHLTQLITSFYLKVDTHFSFDFCEITVLF